ncbi:MAG: pseudouridine-5'-phosphate glycosidase [Clostridiales bacterium]|nr:pseudouridine-5'-phosphate glycosidase [Clostridiales bacterium]
MSNIKNYIEVKPEVLHAVNAGKPVVALESTIISHGMPYPRNVETALKVEEIIRQKGAIPATIAILDGKIRVGLSADEIDFLGRETGVVKTSRRDLPFVLSRKLNGATTVATTMIAAALAGIGIFATGGIGGVHRGAETTMDISADLEELAKTNVCVVCAGAKSILDIGLTLEYLETKGVPVVGFRTDEMPAFYTPSSGFRVEYRADSAEDIAGALKAKWDIGLEGGMVVANPIPKEYAMDAGKINKAIEQALKEAEAQGICGKETTPFLLAKVKELTDGDSLDSNIRLVYNNAALAAQIAVCFSELQRN